MSKKSNPTLIGAFVIAAVFLLVIAVLIFGGSEFLTNKDRAISYFPGSVKGLRVGSNVTFRGVRVGYVKDIQLQIDVTTLESLVQVTMELLPDQLVLTRKGSVLEDQDLYDGLGLDADAFDAGLRAQLNAESFVTGQLLVDLDYRPDTPQIYRGQNLSYLEIPSSPSNIEEVVENVQRFIADIQESVDIKEIARDVDSILDGIDELVHSTDIRESLAGINQVINDEDTQALAASLQAAISILRTTLNDARLLVNNANKKIGPVIDELPAIIERLDSILASGQKTLESVSDQVKGDTQVIYEINTTLNELQGAARSLRIFLDYIERNPEALIRGK